jgi:AcrR family transcriptional regulator
VNASRSARERVRAELIREITEIARRQLATGGAAGLSLRAVAREMGMVSSAIYRYFPSRDDLLTALIIDGYNAVGVAVEKAGAACRRDDYPGRWLAGCQAVRCWALAHPHEYALVYGSPVPGYRAPEQTIGPASRAAAVFGKIVSDAYGAGAMTEPAACPPLPESFQPDAARLRDAVLAGRTRRRRGPHAGCVGRAVRPGELRVVRAVRERGHRPRGVLRLRRLLPGAPGRPACLSAPGGTPAPAAVGHSS